MAEHLAAKWNKENKKIGFTFIRWKNTQLQMRVLLSVCRCVPTHQPDQFYVFQDVNAVRQMGFQVATEKSIDAA